MAQVTQDGKHSSKQPSQCRRGDPVDWRVCPPLQRDQVAQRDWLRHASGLVVVAPSDMSVNKLLSLFDSVEDSFELHLVGPGLLLKCCNNINSRNNINSSVSGKMHLFCDVIAGAPSASPSHRPDTGPPQVDAKARREARPHSAEPEPRSTNGPHSTGSQNVFTHRFGGRARKERSATNPNQRSIHHGSTRQPNRNPVTNPSTGAGGKLPLRTNQAKKDQNNQFPLNSIRKAWFATPFSRRGRCEVTRCRPFVAAHLARGCPFQTQAIDPPRWQPIRAPPHKCSSQ